METITSQDMQKKSCYKFSLYGEFICKYESIREASLKTGLHKSNVSACCHGRRKSTGGFIFAFSDKSFAVKKKIMFETY